ncbi:hypothetical protein BB561_004971 [Smittium simulii]|uniref:Uncharacterized protein n=1 Tax=Smittium simulii TaxID=133385 RepID=A0A2T9YCX7_9FUNG|nr:hypothetical protein BB561_004971 [Smittium simulii]
MSEKHLSNGRDTIMPQKSAYRSVFRHLKLSKSFLCIVFAIASGISYFLVQHLPTYIGLLSNNDDCISKTLILISLDGFRAEYLDRGIATNLRSLGNSGVSLDMFPSFPSVTFPNHYSLATGLYVESHGIVGNVFYDPKLNDTFVYTDPKKSWDSKWWGGEPIWVTAEKEMLKTAIYMWPGSTSVIKDTVPTYLIPFQNNVDPNIKFNKLIEWLQLPSHKRPQLLATYIPEIDQVGHKFGPNSKEVEQSIMMVDEALGNFMSKLCKLNLYNKVNIVVVSDHGMAPSVVPKYVYYLEDLLLQAGISEKDQLNLVCAISLYPLGGVRLCDESKADYVYNGLKSIENTKAWKVFKRADIPKKYNYSKNLRIPTLLIETTGPYIIEMKNKIFNKYEDTHMYESGSSIQTVGVHGYDNFSKNMRAIFLARGPNFPKKPYYKDRLSFSFMENVLNRIKGLFGYTSEESIPYIPINHNTQDLKEGPKTNRILPKIIINNVDVYGIIAKVFGLIPAPNNGTLSIINQIV